MRKSSNVLQTLPERDISQALSFKVLMTLHRYISPFASLSHSLVDTVWTVNDGAAGNMPQTHNGGFWLGSWIRFSILDGPPGKTKCVLLTIIQLFLTSNVEFKITMK